MNAGEIEGRSHYDLLTVLVAFVAGVTLVSVMWLGFNYKNNKESITHPKHSQADKSCF